MNNILFLFLSSNENWFIKHVICEICQNLHVKWDHISPFATLFLVCEKALTNMLSTILKRSWILLVVLKSPRIQFRSLKSNLSWFLYLVLKSPWNIQPCLRQTPFSKENLAHPWCKNLLSSQIALEHFCAWTTFHFCSFFSNAISVPHMKLQVIPSHFASKGVKECQFMK